VVPEFGGTTTVVFFAGGGGLLLLMQPDTSDAASVKLAKTFMVDSYPSRLSFRQRQSAKRA
jgi:hypothetical protein